MTEATGQPAIELKQAPERGALLQSALIGLAWFIALAGMAALVYQYAHEALINEIRAGLARTAKIAAKTIDGDLHATFLRSDQESSEPYQKAILPIREIMLADKQIAFVYSAILRDGKVYFVLDATLPPAPGAPDESVDIMEEYDSPPPDLLRALTTRDQVISEAPYTDKWGTFISAYQPFSNSAGQFVGVVGVDLTTEDYVKRLRPIRHSTFVAGALSLLIALAASAGVWYQRKTDRNVQALARQLKVVNALLNVSHALGSNVGLKNLLPVIVDKTTEVMNAERTSLFLYDRERRMLKGRVVQGMDAGDELRFSDARGVVGRVARTGENANVPDPRMDLDFDPGFDRDSGFVTRNMLVVPVRDSKKRVMAVLQALNRKSESAFDADDEVIITALAAQVQVALEREQMAQAALEKQKLDETLKLAQTIQMSMLSRAFPDPASGIELYADLFPAKTVGGDFYDFFHLNDGRLGLVMADVSGKGIPAALLMAKAMTLIRAFAILDVPPAEVLRMANDDLARENDAAMFVTVFLGILDPASGHMVYANGGHNHSIIVRPGQLTMLDQADGVPLGTMAGMSFEQTSIQLETGDVLYMFTDGVNEAMSVSYEEFGDPRMNQRLLELQSATPEALCHGVVASVRAHAGEAEQSDDITVMALRWTGQRH